MRIILKINLGPILVQVHKRETEPGGERKGAGRGEGGPAQSQLCRKQRGPRGGQLGELVRACSILIYVSFRLQLPSSYSFLHLLTASHNFLHP